MENALDQLLRGPRWHGVPQRAWWALVLISLCLLLPGQCTVPVMDRDEARYAQASKQMLETGDFVDIRFQDEVRYVKPVGTYWLQALSAAAAGGSDADIWAYRVPSWLGALAAILLVAWFGARLYGPRTGFVAALLLALCLGVAVEARTAKTDALLLASTTMAQLALFYILLPRSAEPKFAFWGAPAVFWAAIGLGVIIKGPIGPMVSAATIAAFSLWTRDLSWFKRLRIFPGVLLAFAIAVPWLAAITVKTNGGFLQESMGHAFAGKIAQSDDSHGGPFGYHTLLLPVTFWPGALFLGFGGLYAWRNRKDEIVQFLLCWILPTWLIFELTVTKLPHYTLPVFPAIALLVARSLDLRGEFAGEGTARVFYWVFGLLFVLVTGVLALVAGGADYYLNQSVGELSIVSAIAGLAVLLVGLWALFSREASRVLWLTAGVVFFYLATFHLAIPSVDRFWMTQVASEALERIEGCAELHVATAGYREPSSVFAFGTSTLLGTGSSAATFLGSHADCGVALVADGSADEFGGAVSTAGFAAQALGSVEGYNYVKGDPLRLTIYVHADGKLSAVR